MDPKNKFVEEGVKRPLLYFSWRHEKKGLCHELKSKQSKGVSQQMEYLTRVMKTV